MGGVNISFGMGGLGPLGFGLGVSDQSHSPCNDCWSFTANVHSTDGWRGEASAPAPRQTPPHPSSQTATTTRRNSPRTDGRTEEDDG
jgi:hypothetical protein